MAGTTMSMLSNDWEALNPFIHMRAETLSANIEPTVP